MALKLPNLDDKTFEILVKESFEVLNRSSREWTNNNPSDPGMMIVEMFAHLLEIDVFELNRINNRTYREFLSLLGVNLDRNVEYPSDEEVRAGITEVLRKIEYKRAVSEEDILQIALETAEKENLFARAYCFPDRDFTRFELYEEIAECVKEGHLLVLFIPDNHTALLDVQEGCNRYTPAVRSQERYLPSRHMILKVKRELCVRRLATSRIHVHPVRFTEFQIKVVFVPESGATEYTVKKNIENNIYNFYCPVWGSEEGEGYRPGRFFKRSETVELVENSKGVDYLTSIQISVFDRSLAKWVSVNEVRQMNYYETVWISSLEMEIVQRSE